MTLVAPFSSLGPLTEVQRNALHQEALRGNDRYLAEFIEGQAFCPFARTGRTAGETRRHVHVHETDATEPLLELMLAVADDTTQAVAQVLFPGIEVEPEPWAEFCRRLTADGHARRGGADVLACAPLHPDLAYSERSEHALIPLFRRAPTPTIQWVRLDALARINEGQHQTPKYVDPAEVHAFLNASHRASTYDSVAAANAKRAHAAGLPVVVDLLRGMADEQRVAYRTILS